MNIEEMANQNIVYQTIAGSQSHGLSTPESDMDTLGTFIAVPERMIGLDGLDHIHSEGEDEKLVVLPTYVNHLCSGSETWVSTLFVEPECVLVSSEKFKPILDNRNLFITKSYVRKSLGFMKGMMKRSQNQKSLGEDSKFKHLPQQEQDAMLVVLKHKQMMHAIRVGRMTLEFLNGETEFPQVRRTKDREDLLDIRFQRRSLESTFEEKLELDALIEAKLETTSIPDSVEKKVLDSILVKMITDHWKENKWI